MCEYIILEDFRMDKYIYDDKNGLWYELQGNYYTLALSYQPKKNSLSVYGDSGTNAIYRSIRGCYILHYSQAAN